MAAVPKPEFVGYYSVDENRTYLPESSRLLYYKSRPEGKIHLDLNQGIESFVPKKASDDDEGIDHLLKWIKLNHNKIIGSPESGRWINPNFVSGRGVLRQLLSAKFTPNVGWVIYAAKWKGTIYLRRYIPNATSDNLKKSLFRFFKFTQYMFSDSPDNEPDVSKPINESEEFRCVFRHRIGRHTLLYNAEMTGVCSDTPLTDPLPLGHLKFVELNIKQIYKNRKAERNFIQFKLLEYWCKCFLANVNTVLCGFKDDDNIIREIKSYGIHQLIRMGEGYWDPASCIDYCATTLSKISKHVAKDCTTAIYKFEKKPKDEQIYVTEEMPSPELAILPPSYLE